MSTANGKFVQWRRQNEEFKDKWRPVVNTAVVFSFRKKLHNHQLPKAACVPLSYPVIFLDKF